TRLESITIEESAGIDSNHAREDNIATSPESSGRDDGESGIIGGAIKGKGAAAYFLHTPGTYTGDGAVVSGAAVVAANAEGGCSEQYITSCSTATCEASYAVVEPLDIEGGSGHIGDGKGRGTADGGSTHGLKHPTIDGRTAGIG